MNEKVFRALPVFLKKAVLKLVKKREKEWQSQRLRSLWKIMYGVEVGMGSYGCFTAGNFSKGDVIGNYCSVAGNVWHLNANHPMENATMSPLFYRKEFGNPNAVDVPRRALTVGHDVWIGRDVKILAGVSRIGNGAVIGAGSVVTKDVPPYTVVAGVPAKPIRMRFDEETIAALEDSRWWTLPPQTLMTLQNAVNDPRAFAEEAKKLVEN